MKLAVFDDYRIGVVQGEFLRDVTRVVPDVLRELRVHVNWLIAHWDALLPELAAQAEKAAPIPLSAVKLLPPSPGARHVFAAPVNYRKHIGELGARQVTTSGRSAREQGFFLKAPASLSGAGSDIVLPRGSRRRFDHESELAVVIGRPGRNVRRADAMRHVFGYACLIDLTMRIEPGVAAEERSMRKSFETFTPLGPYVVTADEVPNPQALANRLWVNDELRQDASTGDMIVDIAEFIELVSSVLPLSPGDVLATGTPSGVGPLAPGDRVRIAIERVGEMTLRVREAEVRAPRPF